jgi:hypothetical protein
MTHWSDAAWILAAKAAGAIAGSAVSLAYMLPRDKSEAAIRFIVGIVCGLAFGGEPGSRSLPNSTLVVSSGKPN